MNIVYYSSDLFSEMCGVSILSLCENNKKSKVIDIYIIEDNISELNKNRLREIVDVYGRNIFFIHMPKQKELYPDIKINLGRTYTRMAIGELLPQTVHRVLSLDCDTLILDSIEDMYNIEFNQKEYVAGVYDCLGSAMQEKILHYDKSMIYCNAGVFLIDLSKWRENKVGEQLVNKLMEMYESHSVLYFLEQDLMNMVFYNHLKLLPPRYNLLTSIYLFKYDEVIKMKKPTIYYSKEEVDFAKSHPAIIHATTCFYIKKRMWVKNSDHPYHCLYLKFRKKTPWGELPLIWDHRSIKKRIYAQFWHIMPKKIAIILATIIINYIRPVYAKITAKLNLATIAEQS